MSFALHMTHLTYQNVDNMSHRYNPIINKSDSALEIQYIFSWNKHWVTYYIVCLLHLTYEYMFLQCFVYVIGLCFMYYVCVFLYVFQLVKGIRYTITVELSNTQCKKSTMLRTCDFYPELEKLKVGGVFVSVTGNEEKWRSKMNFVISSHCLRGTQTKCVITTEMFVVK